MNKIIDDNLLFDALGEILDRIEACGASTELTNAVSFTGDLRSAIGNKSNPGNDFSLDRVITQLTERTLRVRK
jgi:hypothetical protein